MSDEAEWPEVMVPASEVRELEQRIARLEAERDLLLDNIKSLRANAQANAEHNQQVRGERDRLRDGINECIDEISAWRIGDDESEAIARGMVLGKLTALAEGGRR